MTDLLTLFCLVDGEFTSRAFSVKASARDTVDDLKKLIRIENAHDFNDLDAKKLTLWLVSVPDDDGDSAVTLDALHEKKKLHPRTYLFNLFPNGSGEDTYIIVQRPPQGNLYYHFHCSSIYLC
jgi:hypothetical protein